MNTQTPANIFIQRCAELCKPLRFAAISDSFVSIFSQKPSGEWLTQQGVASVLSSFDLEGIIKLEWHVSTFYSDSYCIVAAKVKTTQGRCHVRFVTSLPEGCEQSRSFWHDVVVYGGLTIRPSNSSFPAYTQAVTLDQLAAM